MSTAKTASKKKRIKRWFSLGLPILVKNAGLTVLQKKANAEKDCKKILKQDRDGRFWEISSFKWRGSKKHTLTVWLKRKKTNIPPGPGEATVPKPPAMPPPGM